jgi:hypothetical protein
LIPPQPAHRVDCVRAAPRKVRGHLVFCTYARGMLIIGPGSPHASVRSGPSACRLAVTQAPNHAVYYSDAGQIYRIAA